MAWSSPPVPVQAESEGVDVRVLVKVKGVVRAKVEGRRWRRMLFIVGFLRMALWGEIGGLSIVVEVWWDVTGQHCG